MEGANIGSIKALMPSKVSNPHGNFEVIDRWSVGVAHFLELI